MTRLRESAMEKTRFTTIHARPYICEKEDFVYFEIIIERKTDVYIYINKEE